MSTQFTVFFDGQYWVGVLEIVEDQQLRAARHVFGAEPTGPELYEFALHRFAALAAQARKSSAMPIDKAESTRRPGNPKRAARMLAKQRAAPPVSTAAQQALKEALTARAAERRAVHRQTREQDRQLQRTTARRKARERHIGHR